VHVVHDLGYRHARLHRSWRHSLLLALTAARVTPRLRTSFLSILFLLTASALGAEAVSRERDALTIATWNLEWLIAPAHFQMLKQHCIPKGAPPAPDSIPCDVAHRLERSERDFAALARYARELDADVIALQEVDGETAARLVFPDYTFCFTRRAHVQNNGFAIRAGLPHRCDPDLESLSLGDTLRRGAQLTLYPGEPHELRLLSVHLKSGCSDPPLSRDDKACRDLTRQAPRLREWMDEQDHAGRPYVVLGDFNRDLLSDAGPGGLWQQLSGAGAGRLVNAASGEPFRKCVPGQGYAAYIDHIVLSRGLAAGLVPGSFARLTYRPIDARRTRLSDHCPVAVRTRIQQIVAAPDRGELRDTHQE
jgi:endonuclease/exonuclease/phosphatase family metal-dependent hydrolase